MVAGWMDGCCAAEAEQNRESFPFCQRYIITTLRAVSYFSPFVFNLAVSESCILFAAAAANAHNANSFLSAALCASAILYVCVESAICASRISHFRRRGVKLVLHTIKATCHYSAIIFALQTRVPDNDSNEMISA